MYKTNMLIIYMTGTLHIIITAIIPTHRETAFLVIIELFILTILSQKY